jgi:hypothetical protein
MAGSSSSSSSVSTVPFSSSPSPVLPSPPFWLLQLLLDPLLLEHELYLSTSPHHQAVPVTQPELPFLLLTLNVNSCHHDVLSTSVPGLPSQHCSSSTGYWVRHHVPVLDDRVTNHHIVLYLVLHPFHATSDRSNKHSLCNNDDHTAQRCQLQVLSDLQC